MNALHYPVILEPADEGGFVVSFPDVPEAITQGDTREAALSNAVDALETALDFYIDDKRPLPQPSSPEGLDTVSPSVHASAKLMIYQLMRDQDIGKAELARRLSCHLPQIDRILSLSHGSRFEQLEAAVVALGGRLQLQLLGPESRSMTVSERTTSSQEGRRAA